MSAWKPFCQVNVAWKQAFVEDTCIKLDFFVMVFYAVLVSFSSVSPVLQGLHKTAACLVCLVSERI